MAAETETLMITMPVELMDRIRALVEEGKFLSENDIIIDALREAVELSRLPGGPINMSDDTWEEELQRRIVQFEQGKTPLRTLDEVSQEFVSLRQERKSA